MIGGLVEDGIWYHTSCYIRKIKKRISILENKTKTGKITLDESKEGNELQKLLKNILINESKPIIPNDKQLLNRKAFTFQTKPMPGIYAKPSIPIIPYYKQVLLENKTNKSLIISKTKIKAAKGRKPQG